MKGDERKPCVWHESGAMFTSLAHLLKIGSSTTIRRRWAMLHSCLAVTTLELLSSLIPNVKVRRSSDTSLPWAMTRRHSCKTVLGSGIAVTEDYPTTEGYGGA